MNRKFRLTRSTDFKRVRRLGKSYAHPLAVLVVLPSQHEGTRFGLAAGRSVGNAIQRNRAKRLLREAIRPLLTDTLPGYDVIVLSRYGTPRASFQNVQSAVLNLFHRAHLLKELRED